MSVYSQNMYGQPPSYGGHGYPPIAPVSTDYHQYYHHPAYTAPPPAPPPPPTFPDPVSFRREFATRLSELSTNSRPHITNLGYLAQENTQFADIVVQCLESHIRRVPPWMKLPAFYVLDSMSKNIYEPYARLFSPLVPALFIEAYGQVDQATRRKMEEMLLTWRTGSPSGKELFGLAIQTATERGIWGDGTSNPSHSGLITKNQVLSELQFTLGQKERALQQAPHDTVTQNHIGVLQQLRRLVEAGVTQEELKQILSQLRNLLKMTPMRAAPIQQPAPAPQWPPVPHTYHAPPHMLAPTPTPASAYHAAPSAPIATGSNVKSEQLLGFLSPLGGSSAQAPTPPVMPEIGSILGSLMKSGILSNSAESSADKTPEDEHSQELKEAAIQEYREAILSQNVTLNTFDLAKAKVPFVDFLYTRQNSQCKQCGIRFPSGDSGKKQLDDHLDMHFRQNRKANQNGGRGHIRSRFIPVEDWVYDDSVNDKGKGRAPGLRDQGVKVDLIDDAERIAELRAQYVVVPSGEEAQLMACPICKEVLKCEFLEDEEEWVWKNAVRKDDKIYHATCHAEAAVSKNTLAARLRTDNAHGSRSVTPELGPGMRGSASPPAAAGLKRKAEEGGADSESSLPGTPPNKKLALSS